VSGFRSGFHGRRGWIDFIIVGVFTSLILGSVFYLLLMIYFRSAGVPHGVYFLGQDLGGMSASYASEAMENIATSSLSRPIYLHYKNRIWVLRYPKHFRFEIDTRDLTAQAIRLGKVDRSVKEHILHWINLDYPQVDLPFNVKLNRAFTQSSLMSVLSDVLEHRVFARHAQEGQVELQYLSDEIGVNELLDRIEKSLNESPHELRREIHIDPRDRGGTKKIVPIDDEREGFSVTLASKSFTLELIDPLTYDLIVQSSGVIDGTLVNPGETFSLAAATTDARAKWRPYGGTQIGLGYLASCMYEPLLKAGAKILRRDTHKNFVRSLAFVEPGFDAAMGANQDLKFLNDQKIPLLLKANLGSDPRVGLKLSFSIRSVQKLATEVRIHTGRVSKDPFETRWMRDPTLRRGEERVKVPGIEGIGVKVYRILINRTDGRQISKEIVNDSRYAMQNAVVLVPPDFVPPGVEAIEVAPGPRPVPSSDPLTEFDSGPGYEDPTASDDPLGEHDGYSVDEYDATSRDGEELYDSGDSY